MGQDESTDWRLPEAASAESSALAWAQSDGALAALLAAGLSTHESLIRWGLSLGKAHRWADAALAYGAAAALAPHRPDVWTNLGVALDRTGATHEACSCFERSVAILREQPDTWLLLGMARRRLADAAGSEAAYRVALAIAPRSIAAWQCLGVLKEEQRDHPAAIECFETCLKLGEGTPAVSANLGRLYAQTGRLIDAHDAYDSAARREPSNAHYVTMTTQMRFFRDVLLGAPVHDALRAYSAGAGAPLPAGESRADAELSWLDKAGAQMASFGLIEGATRVVLHRLERGHATPTATYLLQALRKDPALDRCPSDYIVESFNAFAGDFDAKLVGELGYRLPETIDELLRSAHITGPLPNVLDAGCGTGLCGRFLRPLAVRLEGVDLSPRMLDKARLLALYDRLECSDLVAFLVASPTPYDLVVAADVLIYLGDLRPLFAAAARAIAPGGWFLGSIEALDGRGYGVLPSGRFAHAPSYVRDVAARAFVEITCIETGLRLEGPERVRGAVFLWRRVGAGDPLPA